MGSLPRKASRRYSYLKIHSQNFLQKPPKPQMWINSPPSNTLSEPRKIGAHTWVLNTLGRYFQSIPAPKRIVIVTPAFILSLLLIIIVNPSKVDKLSKYEQ